MRKPDYYVVLEVKRSASAEELKRSYRRLARAYHPDRNGGGSDAEDRFKLVVEAWEVLGDPDRRRHYDLFGHQTWGPGGGGSPDFTVVPFDLAEQLRAFGRGAKARVLRRAGGDLRITVQLTLRDVLLGTVRKLELPRRSASGAIVRKLFEFSIPPGVAEGRVLRWKGFGAPGRYGGAHGDLLVRVAVEPHAVFYFEGDALFFRLCLHEAEAMHGAQVEVPSPWGVRTLDVSPRTTDGEVLTLPAAGGLARGGRRRDLHARVQVIGTALGAERCAALEADREALARYVAQLRTDR